MKIFVKNYNLLFFMLLISFSFEINAADKKSKDEAKSLSGISIVGNKEAPKSLFIVPWKNSEIGFETGLSSSLLNEKMLPVDKDVFARELNFYSVIESSMLKNK